MDIQKILDFQFWGNDGANYFKALIIFLGSLILFKIFQFFLIKKIEKITKKTKTDIDDFFVDLIKSVKPPFYLFIALFISFHFLNLAIWFKLLFNRIIMATVALQTVLILQKVIDYSAGKVVEKITDTDANEKERVEETAVIKTISKILKFVLWITAVLLLLSNMGVNVTSAIAGMGIGGIAMAMAAKDILSDIIAAVSIYLDKPFKVGQRIQVGNDVGTVEHIGIKTTRLKTPQGQELVVSNRDITGARVQNFKKMDRRRVTFVLGVVYGLSAKKLEQIPEFIEIIISEKKEVEFDRCHFTTYGDFSLNFETVYFVNSSDKRKYLDIQQEINLDIYKKFEEEGIEFAYPTQTVYLEKSQN